MFQPSFVYDSKKPSALVEVARNKGFRMIDMWEPGASVHGYNTPVVMYDVGLHGFRLDRTSKAEDRLWPPKRASSVQLNVSNGTEVKGWTRSMADPIQFLEWFFGRPAKWVRPGIIHTKFRV